MSISIVGVSSSAPSSGSTSHSLNLPSGTQEGDLAFLILTQNGTQSFVPPSGWTQVGITQTPNNALFVRVFQKILTSSDVSASWSFGGTQRCVRACIVLRDAEYYSQSGGAVVTENTVMNFPNLFMEENGLVLAMSGMRHASTSTGVASNIDYVERVDVSDGSGTAPRFGVYISSKEASAAPTTVGGDQTTISAPSTKGMFTIAVVEKQAPSNLFRGWGIPA